MERTASTIAGRATPAWVGPAATAGAALVGCALVGVVDPATPGSYGVCPFLALTGRWCPGCGTLRAVNRLVHGDVVAALGLNVLFVASVPLLVWWWLAWALPTVGGPTLRQPVSSSRAVWLILAVVVAFGVLRNLPFAPFSALAP